MQSLCKMFVKWPVHALRLPANARKMMLDTAKGANPMIYYVEDDDNIRELVVYTLTQMSLPCRGFSDGAAFRAAIAAQAPDLALLDVMLPGEDGLSLLCFLRENPRTAELPVIMLTAKGAEMDKVQGLDYGADDYIVKPFGMAELVARIRACLRRSQPRTGTDALEQGPLTIDRRAHKVFLSGAEIALTLKEYELLLTFLQNPRRVFTRDQLLDKVWGFDYLGDSRTVDVHIKRLREKLEGVSDKWEIETVWRKGYKFKTK